MKKLIKRGTVAKTDSELLLLAGSRITTITSDGEVVEYVLASDTSVVLEHDARLFPTR
jgi:hypothetical protein